MTLLEEVKILTSENNEELLKVLINKTKLELESIIGRVYDSNWDNLCSDIVVVKYNRRNNEGLSSVTSNGMNESYANTYPHHIREQIRKFKGSNVRFF